MPCDAILWPLLRHSDAGAAGTTDRRCTLTPRVPGTGLTLIVASPTATHPRAARTAAPYNTLAALTPPPPSALATATSADGAMARLRKLKAPIDRYLALRDLMSADARAYYSLLLSHTEEILPFVYTVRGARGGSARGGTGRETGSPGLAQGSG